MTGEAIEKLELDPSDSIALAGDEGPWLRTAVSLGDATGTNRVFTVVFNGKGQAPTHRIVRLPGEAA